MVLPLRSPTKRANALFHSAQRLVGFDRYDAAIVLLNQAIKQMPAAQFYDYRGVVLSLTWQREAALESFANALELAASDSERASIYFHRGLLYGREQHYEQALLDLTWACDLNHFETTYREALDSATKEACEVRDAPL